jgi:hypothetical protein
MEPVYENGCSQSRIQVKREVKMRKEGGKR